MNTREALRAQAARRRLAELLSEPGGILPGGLVERMMRCGKHNCRCKSEPPQLHGPYLQWGYSKDRKRFTRWLTPDQVERYRPQIERGRRFTELLEELDEAELRRVERAEGWGA
jgi:hypothetical protein